MRAKPVQSFFRCAACGALSPLVSDLHDFDPAEFLCEHCGAATWVQLDEVLDREGARYVSHRRDPADELGGTMEP